MGPLGALAALLWYAGAALLALLALLAVAEQIYRNWVRPRARRRGGRRPAR